MSQAQTTNKAETAAPSASISPQSAGFDPLSALSDVEKSLQGLKKLYEERRELETRLAEAQGVINQRQTELATMQAALEAETVRAKETAAELAALREETKTQLAEARTEREALEAKSASIEARQSELEKQIAQQRSLIDSKQQELEEATKAIAAKAKQEIEKARSDAERSREEVAKAAAEAEKARADADAARAEADSIRTQAQAEVEKVKVEANSARSESERTKTVATELESFAAELNALQKELDEARTAVDADRVKVVEAVERLKTREAALNERDAELAKRQAAVEAASQRESQDLSKYESERTELERRVATESDAAEQLKNDLESVVRRCAAQEEVLSEYEQLLSVERSHVHTLMERIQREGAGADEIEASLVELRQCLAAERNARSAAVEGSESSLQQIAEASAKVREHEEKVASLEKELAAAKALHAKQQHTIERLGNAKPGAATSGGTSVLRRKRLSRYRSILREQVDKVRRASEVLAKRFEQCEQVLGMRAEVMAAKRQVENAHAKVQRQASTKRAAALTLYCVLILGTLAALSWAAVNQVMPGVFAATTELTADGRGRELSDAELDEWKRSLEETLADPRFIDLVADRMKKRGYDALGTGGAMKTFLASRFSHESPSPGSIKLEVRADGRDRAARSLDIIATALASDANANRERRADGAVTLIKSPAVAGDRPVHDTRPMHAGMVLGVSSLLTLGLGTLLWGRLAKAKTDFEMGSQIDQVLDEARWSEFTAATTNKRPSA